MHTATGKPSLPMRMLGHGPPRPTYRPRTPGLAPGPGSGVVSDAALSPCIAAAPDGAVKGLAGGAGAAAATEASASTAASATIRGNVLRTGDDRFYRPSP